MQDPSEKISVIGKDGRVRSVPFYMKDSLLKQGFHLIVNAKEEYYPQYDQRNAQYEAKDINIIEDIEPSNYLEVKKI